MMYRSNDNQRGFTLIELLISSTIFIIVITVAISALLAMNRAQRITRFKKQQFDTLNAVMEDMVRNIRTSYHVRCDLMGDYADPVIETPKDCVNGSGDDAQASSKIAFEGVDGVEGDASDQIVYSILQDADGFWGVYKSNTGDTGPFVRLTPSPISISSQNSGFSVLYSENPADGEQPFVTIRLSGTITYQNETSTFNIQTAVTPRALEF